MAMQGTGLVVAVAACAAGLAGCSAGAPGATVPAGSAPATTAAPSGVKLASAKIAPALAAMARRIRATTEGSAASSLSTALVHVDAAGEIQAYVHVARLGPDIERALRNAGARIERASTPLGVYQVWATPEAIERMAALGEVIRITPPTYGFARPGVPAPAT